MAPYHVVLIHFPIALWMTAALAFVFCAVSSGPLAKAIDRALVPILAVGLVAGVAAYGVGLLVWPWETISSTPLGRNHVLLATWTLAFWALLLVTRWYRGEAVREGPTRWIMAALAVLGSILLGITGTLGGHLVGIYTEVSQALRFLGWEVYTTFYVPTFTVIAIGIAILVLIAIGVLGSRQPQPQHTGIAERTPAE